MAYEDTRWVPGSIYLNPTSTSVPGDFIGETVSLHFLSNTRYASITAEEYGNSIVAQGKVGDDPMVLGILTVYSDFGFKQLWPGARTTASGTELVFGTFTSPEAPGQLRSTVEMLFVPEDRESDRYIYFPAAIMRLGDMGAMNLRLDQEINISFSFLGTPAAETYQSGYHGKAADIDARITQYA